ncbi:uncharacterized protein LOC133779101 [Humulus lupulus]|uniref:uncharacterized protein LOC133779101 n=1 Tax=Humulus lupulus TaxID=3486 RepID=UPI002B41022F|nr:uncharacterized protein LOC133779101 [Humulus lupulus]
MVKTRGSGSRSVKDLKAGSLTASSSLTKKNARKSTLSQPSLINATITTSKAMVIPDLEAPKVPSGPPSSAAPLASAPRSSKKVRASLSDDVSDHDGDSAKTHSDSTESPDVLGPKKKKQRVVPGFLFSKIPSVRRMIPLKMMPSIDDDVASEAEFDPSEDPPVSPKGKKVVKIPEIRTKVFGVIKNIEDRWWLGSLTGFDGFVPRVVQEFYCNLNDALFDSNAAEIAKVLNLPPTVINVAMEFNKDKVLSELVGQNMVWEQHSVLKVADLTHYYVLLHKFATNNWIPTTHTSSITFDTTFFLFKVRTGLQVDLATLIFDQIAALGKAKKKGQYLVFPHLIYKLLDSQKSLRLEYEIVTTPTAGVDYKLKKESSSVKTTKGISIKAGDADSVITELAGVKATLESVQTEVFSLKNCLSTMMSRFAARPSK